MNDQLQKALADLLGKASQGVDAGVSFLQAQLPDVIQQLLLWKAVASFMVFVALITIGVGLAWVMVKAYKTEKIRRDLISELHRAERLTDRPSHMFRPLNEEDRIQVAAGREKERVITENLAKLPALQISSMVVGVMYAPLLMVICAWGFTWLQILIAPKLYLIEYAASLGK